MNPFRQRSSYSSRSVGVVLLVGVLAGVTVGGGFGVIAATSTKTVTVCANKKTNVLRYAKNGRCARTERRLILNQAGAAGVKGDTGATGAQGPAGAAGAQGPAGANGAAGIAGVQGPPGANGAAGTNGTNGIGSFIPQSVCGANGITLCAVGLQGPGGGLIFYVDSFGLYSDFDYLEVAPTDGVFAANASPFNSTTIGPWSTTIARCGLTQDANCQTNWLTASGEALKYRALDTGRAGTAAIVARHEAGGVAKNMYAAGVADAYTTPTATDWWLPSYEEGVLIIDVLDNDAADNLYWTSTERAENLAEPGITGDGIMQKQSALSVRAIRGF